MTADNWNACGKAVPVVAINTINSFLNLNWVADEENNGIEIRLYIIIISGNGDERVLCGQFYIMRCVLQYYLSHCIGGYCSYAEF